MISASSQTFHLKAGNDVDRQKWLSALEYSRHKAIKQAESGGFWRFFIFVLKSIGKVYLFRHFFSVIRRYFEQASFSWSLSFAIWSIPDEDEEAHLGFGESRVSVLQKTHKELLKKLDDLQTAARILGECDSYLKSTFCQKNRLLPNDLSHYDLAVLLPFTSLKWCLCWAI